MFVGVGLTLTTRGPAWPGRPTGSCGVPESGARTRLVWRYCRRSLSCRQCEPDVSTCICSVTCWVNVERKRSVRLCAASELGVPRGNPNSEAAHHPTEQIG